MLSDFSLFRHDFLPFLRLQKVFPCSLWLLESFLEAQLEFDPSQLNFPLYTRQYKRAKQSGGSFARNGQKRAYLILEAADVCTNIAAVTEVFEEEKRTLFFGFYASQKNNTSWPLAHTSSGMKSSCRWVYFSYLCIINEDYSW